MNKRLYFFIVALIFSGCKAYYNYYPSPPITSFFNNAGEAHVSGDLSTGGLEGQAGVAVTNNISLIGMYGGSPFYSTKAGGYGSSDAELGLGYTIHLDDKNEGLLNFTGGYGFGHNNDRDSGAMYSNFYGRYTKPFLQFTIGGKYEHADIAFTLKLDYLTYTGYKLNTNGNGYYSFDASNFFYEPYLSGSVGGNVVRFTYGTGFAIKQASDFGSGVHIFPFQFNIGLYIIINRNKG